MAAAEMSVRTTSTGALHRAERLVGEQRQRVRLLPARASGAPDPDGPRPGRAGQPVQAVPSDPLELPAIPGEGRFLRRHLVDQPLERPRRRPGSEIAPRNAPGSVPGATRRRAAPSAAWRAAGQAIPVSPRTTSASSASGFARYPAGLVVQPEQRGGDRAGGQHHRPRGRPRPAASRRPPRTPGPARWPARRARVPPPRRPRRRCPCRTAPWRRRSARRPWRRLQQHVTGRPMLAAPARRSRRIRPVTVSLRRAGPARSSPRPGHCPAAGHADAQPHRLVEPPARPSANPAPMCWTTMTGIG